MKFPQNKDFYLLKVCLEFFCALKKFVILLQTENLNFKKGGEKGEKENNI